MNLILIFLLTGNIIFSRAENVGDDHLKEAIKDYSNFQNDIQRMLAGNSNGCEIAGQANEKFCSLKNYCEILNQSKDNISILNRDSKILKSCMKEAFASELAIKKDQFIALNKKNYLKKLNELNQKLKKQLSKNQENAKLQIIQNEILSLSINAENNLDKLNWDKKDSTEKEMLSDIAMAEKNTKTKLSVEVKSTLVEMQLILKNKDYEKEARELEDNLFPDVKNKNIFYNWDLLTDAKAAGSNKILGSNQALYTKKAQEAYEIFKTTKSKMISYLESLKNEKNSNGINRAIERVMTIKFNPPILTQTIKRQCAMPNAFYDISTHSFTLCPQMLEAPRIALIETIAHEIAHSFDPCTMSQGMTKKFGPEIVEHSNSFELNLKMDVVKGNYSAMDFNDLSIKKNLYQDQLKYADNPFSKTISCLQSDESISAQKYDIKKVKSILENALDEMKKNGQDNINVGKFRYYQNLHDNFEIFFQYAEGCNLKVFNVQNALGQLEESFADKLSSEIVALDMAEDNPKIAAQKMLEIIANFPSACIQEENIDQKMIEIAKKYQCPNFFASKTYEQKIIQGLIILEEENNDTHPNDGKRINQILLAHPKINHALNCPQQKSGVKYCE